jgi:hypothetical protein
MTAIVPRRREWIAYGAGVAVIACLMAIVVLGGHVITAKKPIIELTPSHVSAANGR